MRSLFFLILIFFAFSSYAQVVFDNPYMKKVLRENPGLLDYSWEECAQVKNLKVINLKKDHIHQHRETFDFYYRHIINHPNQTTLVFLPGGPGGGSITDEQIESLFPSSFNYILIDPRGTGCNFMSEGDFPAETVTSEQTALDILEVIKKESLKKYIIWGESYGTLLGTILTSQINKRQMNQPKF